MSKAFENLKTFNKGVSSKRRILGNTLDTLEQDEKFLDTAERFLSSVGSSADDIFEYLRDSDYNLRHGMDRAMQSKKWSRQQKKDYQYLRSRFDNADTGSLQQYLEATKDIGIDIATDPFTVASVLLTPVTGGTSLAARAALGEGAKQGLKRMAMTQTGKAVGVHGVEGAAWGGLDNHFRQETEVNTGMRRLYSNKETAQHAALGGLLGGLAGGLTQKASIYYSKQADKFSDDTYLLDGDSIYKARRAKDIAIASTIGKPTAVLNTISKYSDSAKLLRNLFRYDASKTFTSRTTSPLDFSYGELTDFRRGYYKQKYEEAIAPLYRTGTLNPEYSEAIVYLLRGGDFNELSAKFTNEELTKVGSAHLKIKQLFNEVLNDAEGVGIKINKVADYFPRSWNRKAIDADPQRFADLLVTKGVVDEKDVGKVIDGMLNKHNELFSSHSNLITKQRIFKNLNDNEFTEFLNNDLHEVSIKYLFESARVIERKKAFGVPKNFKVRRIKSEKKEKTVEKDWNLRETTKSRVDTLKFDGMDMDEEFRTRWLDTIEQEMRANGKVLTKGDKTRIMNLYKSVTGQVDYYDSVITQNIYDATKISQAMAHLPLATVSSVTEILIPFMRSTPDKATKNLLKSMKGYQKHLAEDIKTMLKDKHGMSEPEMIKEMQSVFLAVDEAVADRIESLAGEGIQNELVKKVGRGFFKANLLTDWTRFVQLVSFNTGKDVIRDNLTKINQAVKAGKSLDSLNKGKLGRYKEELFDLNINIEQGLDWLNRGASTNSQFYQQDVLRGAARFTNEVILNPAREKAIKPVIQSNPKFDILFQFLGYPTAFSNTVLKNAVRSIVRDPVSNAPRVLIGGMIMVQMAMFFNDWRKTDKQKKLAKKRGENEVVEALQRIGALGPLEHPLRYYESLSYTKTPLSSAALLGGPIIEDVVGTIAYRRGIAETLARNMPGYGLKGRVEDWTGFSYDKSVIDKAKEADKTVATWAGFRQKPKGDLDLSLRSGLKDGGLLEEKAKPDDVLKPTVNVPKAEAYPPDRINPYTGEPYTATYYNRNNREEFALGGLLSKQITKKITKHTRPSIEKSSKINMDVEDISKITEWVDSSKESWTQKNLLKTVDDYDLKNISKDYLQKKNLVDKDGNVTLYRYLNIPEGKTLQTEKGIKSLTTDLEHAKKMAKRQSSLTMERLKESETLTQAEKSGLSSGLDRALSGKYETYTLERPGMVLEYKVPLEKIEGYLPSFWKNLDEESLERYKRYVAEDRYSNLIDDAMDEGLDYDEALEEVMDSNAVTDFIAEYVDTLSDESEALVNLAGLTYKKIKVKK